MYPIYPPLKLFIIKFNFLFEIDFSIGAISSPEKSEGVPIIIKFPNLRDEIYLGESPTKNLNSHGLTIKYELSLNDCSLNSISYFCDFILYSYFTPIDLKAGRIRSKRPVLISLTLESPSFLKVLGLMLPTAPAP